MASVHPNLTLSSEDLAAFCRRWNVIELALFGSVVRDDFGPESDLDVMVRFGPSSGRSLFDLVRMTDELRQLTGREVDIVEFGQVTNPFRRRSIERDLTVVYAA